MRELRQQSLARTRIGPVLVFIAVCITNCRKPAPPEPAVSIEYKITPFPPHVGASKVELKLIDGSGSSIVGAQVRLEGHMTHPGMRPVLVEAHEAELGRYESSLDFTMAGDWIVLVQILLPNGQRVERQFEVTGVGPG